jgi:hypothetical protein
MMHKEKRVYIVKRGQLNSYGEKVERPHTHRLVSTFGHVCNLPEHLVGKFRISR